MAGVVPRRILERHLAVMLRKAAAEDLVLRLYANDFKPDEEVVLGDLREVSGGGYGPKFLGPDDWRLMESASAEVGEQAVSFPQTFVFSAGVGRLLGYFLTGQTTGELYGAERFPAPFIIEDDRDMVTVTARYRLSNQPRAV